jgi:HNH endonuclease
MRDNMTIAQVFYRDLYLDSDKWKVLKQRYWASDLPKRCAICWKRVSLVLHHRTYYTLGNERLGEDVILLCKRCHRTVHFNWRGKKTPLGGKYLRDREAYLRRRHVTWFLVSHLFFLWPKDFLFWSWRTYRIRKSRSPKRVGQ